LLAEVFEEFGADKLHQPFQLEKILFQQSKSWRIQTCPTDETSQCGMVNAAILCACSDEKKKKVNKIPAIGRAQAYRGGNEVVPLAPHEASRTPPRNIANGV
jgi:hypothetical protein